jgi:hypothetical protein
MKILLDESVTKRLKEHLKEFEVLTVSEGGWSGIQIPLRKSNHARVQASNPSTMLQM